jgi:uncharacterized membrane protein (DUF485 family)
MPLYVIEINLILYEQNLNPVTLSNNSMRKGLVVAWLAFLFASIVAIFRHDQLTKRFSTRVSVGCGAIPIK